MKKYLFIILLFISCNHSQEIKTDPVYTIAKVVETRSDGKGGFSLIYKYSVNGIEFKSERVKFFQCENKFKGKFFPVVYYRKNPKHSILLVAPRDYFSWGRTFPDSLEWVYDCTKGFFDPKTFKDWKEMFQP